MMYQDFAQVYDELMEDVPYEKWADMLHELILRYGITKPSVICDTDTEDFTEEEKLASERNLVLDLCCGTGTVTELMAEKGYDLIGVDGSEEMLNQAVEKRDKSGHEILYLCQDMRELDLYSTVGTIYCLYDSLNYLLTKEDIAKVFRLAAGFLYPEGLFIFDFNTTHKYGDILGDGVMAEDRGKLSFIWDNLYDPATCQNEAVLTVFRETEDGSGLFRKISEIHEQRGYTLAEILDLLAQAGLSVVKAFDLDTGEERPAEEASERIFIVARKRIAVNNR